MARDCAVTKVSTEEQPQIPDDIFQAAMAASEQDSDGDDPYGPQPKRFMQTEQQKRQYARDLEIRRVAYTIRKMKKTHQADLQRLQEQEQHGSAFEQLPTDLILMLMQHTHWQDIYNLSNSSAINRGIFQANEKAVYRGMETAQFPEWEWLFGNSKRRSPAQAQHLKDAILTMTLANGWVPDDQLLEILQMIDQNEFTGKRNAMFLQGMQDNLDMEHRAIESYTGKKISRRTAMCLTSLAFHRPYIMWEEDTILDKPYVNFDDLPWDARCQLVNEQPASIQAEIRLFLKVVVETFGEVLQAVVRQWIERNQSAVYQQTPGVVKKWMSKLMAGLILEALIPAWQVEAFESAPFNWDYYISDLDEELREVLDEYDGGNVNVINKAAKDGVEFGKIIGLALEGFLDGTSAGEAFDKMALSLESAQS